MKKNVTQPFLALAGLVLLGSIATTAQATVIFSQDFESGLGAGESTGGAFAINSTGALNNGTLMMGHPTTYSDDEYSYYEVALDLSGFSGVTLSFDWTASFETHFDRFNVLAAAGAIAPPGGLLTPTSGMTYVIDDHDHRPELGSTFYDTSSEASGTALFDLSAFDNGTVNVRFQFGSDFSVIADGFNMDNLLVEGLAVDAPEPATLALLGLGLAAFGARRKLAA